MSLKRGQASARAFPISSNGVPKRPGQTRTDGPVPVCGSVMYFPVRSSSTINGFRVRTQAVKNSP